MPEIDPVVLKLIVDDREYRRGIKTMSQVAAEEFGLQEKRVRRLEQEMRRSSSSIGASLKGLAGTIAAAFTGRELVGLLDSFTRYENALKVAGLEGQNLATVQEQLFNVAQRNGVQLEAIGTLYGRAAQSADTLGASQAELLKFTEAVSASLRITGTSTQEASGSLLQLGQALGSPRVQAEEFNSIIDTMRPLLKEAAKEIDGTGGTLDGLIRKLKDAQGPGVSNIELFQGIVKALERLEETAGKTALTVSAGFTNLGSALTRYFGEADKANGVSAALGAAIQTLAHNVDLIIPSLAIVATALGANYAVAAGAATVANISLAASAVGAATSMTATGAAAFAMQARLAGAATTTEALSFAMAGLSRALPVLAITAIVGALGYMAIESKRASMEVAALDAEIESTGAEADAMEARLQAAGIETDNLGSAAQTARGDMVDLTGGMEGARQKAAELGNQAVQTAKQLAQMRLQEILGERQDITDARNSRKRARAAPQGYSSVGLRSGEAGELALRPVEDAQLARLDQLEQDIRRKIAYLDAGGALALPGGVSPRSAIVSAGKPGKSPGRQADPAVEARREAQARAAFANELDQLQADELAARAELTGSIEDKMKADLARLDADARSFARQVALDEGLDDAQRQKLIAERAEVTALDRRARIRDAEIAEIERRTRILAEQNRNEGSYLQSQLRLIDDREERARVEHAILDLQYETEKAELRANIAALKLAGAKEEEVRLAEQRLALLEKQHAVDSKVIDQDNRSPLQRYFDDLDKTETELRDDAERLVIQEIEYVRRGMRDAISDALGVDDPLLGGLIDLLIEQLVIKPLAKSLAAASEGGEGGGFIGTAISAIGSFFGGFKATGGPVSAGKAYVVGERGPEIMVPGASGTVIPNHAIAAANSPLRGGGAASGGVVKLVIEEGPQFASRVRAEATGVAIEVQKVMAPKFIDAAANETARRFSRPKL